MAAVSHFPMAPDANIRRHDRAGGCGIHFPFAGQAVAISIDGTWDQRSGDTGRDRDRHAEDPRALS